MSAPHTWIVELLDVGDGSGDAILTFPDALIAQLGWKEGDILELDGKENAIWIRKSNNEHASGN